MVDTFCTTIPTSFYIIFCHDSTVRLCSYIVYLCVATCTHNLNFVSLPFGVLTE